MKKFIYLATLTLLVFATSCIRSEVDELIPPSNSKNSVEIVGRIVPFTNRYVTTRVTGKTDAEKNIESMCFAIFRNNECQGVNYVSNNNPTFVISKDVLQEGDVFYIFANISDPTDDVKAGDPLDKFLELTSEVNGIVEVPTFIVNGEEKSGFPMIGSYTITSKDALPAIVPIPLEPVYAKIMLEIEVDPDQEVDGYDLASFTLEGFTVHDVIDKVDFKGGTVSKYGADGTDDGNSILMENDQPKVFDGSHTLNPEEVFAQGKNRAVLSFYLPERYLRPNFYAETYQEYPFEKGTYSSQVDADQNGYRDEEEKYFQRYKPLLAEGKNPTFVRFFGEYIDHKGDNFNVSYDIYVGGNAYDNYDIERNLQYNNYIVIRGLTTSSNESTNPNSISIDHRVNIERVEPIITNLRRETLLDSHFEVRPLRIRKNPDYKGSVDNASVKVEVIYKDQAGADWIGIERSFGDGNAVTTEGGTYLVASELPDDKKNAAGKRRYFTSDLTTTTLGTVVVDIPVTEAGECVWIYVDETNPNNAGDKVRSATVRVTYLLNGSPSGEPIEYIINQRELFSVNYGENEYLIEYHEEYLHNYDVEDSYGQTENEGMTWGLNNIQMSYQYPAVHVSGGLIDNITETINNLIQSFAIYDFYLSRDNGNSTTRDYSGFEFCSDIINVVNGNITPQYGTEINTNPDDDISELSLAQDPESAVEYCYNKNKRKTNGTVDNVEWYLPAIDEIEEIVMSKYDGDNFSYIRFEDFRGKFYWSSQPAYYHNNVVVKRSAGGRYGEYYSENTQSARATKVYFKGGDPTDYQNNYTKEPSGMTGSYQLLTVNMGGLFTPSYNSHSFKDITETTTTTWSDGSNWLQTVTETIYKPEYEAGYLPREDKNKMARVRCVRKK